MIPDKVTITITGDDYTVEVWDGERLMSHRKTIMESVGRGKAEKKGDVFDDLPEDFGELAEAVEDVSLDLFSIAGELYQIKESI